MPTYTYRREDGTTFEIEQRITADALETCPTTGQKVSRIVTGGAGLVFRGSGFYLTDYARKSETTSNGDSKPSSDTAKSEPKPQTKPASSPSSDD